MGGGSGHRERGSVQRTTCECGQTGRLSCAVWVLLLMSSECTRVPSLASPGFCACHSSLSVIGSFISACISEDCPFESLSARNPSMCHHLSPARPRRVQQGSAAFLTCVWKVVSSSVLLYHGIPVHPSGSHLPLQPSALLTLALWCTVHVFISCSLLYHQDQPGQGQRGTADWGDRTQQKHSKKQMPLSMLCSLRPQERLPWSL